MVELYKTGESYEAVSAGQLMVCGLRYAEQLGEHWDAWQTTRI